MALLVSKEAGNRGKLGIWHITESLDELLRLKSFSTEDLAILNTFGYDQRKKEWLVARILAEKLAGKENTRIIYNEYNKPFLLNSKTHISLSHSHNLLSFILDETETGIDIELVKPKILNIKEKFMSGKELNALQKENIAEHLTVYWCAKESLYKLYGKKEIAFKYNLFIEPFQCSEKGNIKGWIKNNTMNKCFSLHYEKLFLGRDSYMLAYIINQD